MEWGCLWEGSHSFLAISVSKALKGPLQKGEATARRSWRRHWVPIPSLGVSEGEGKRAGLEGPTPACPSNKMQKGARRALRITSHLSLRGNRHTQVLCWKGKCLKNLPKRFTGSCKLFTPQTCRPPNKCPLGEDSQRSKPDVIFPGGGRLFPFHPPRKECSFESALQEPTSGTEECQSQEGCCQGCHFDGLLRMSYKRGASCCLAEPS